MSYTPYDPEKLNRDPDTCSLASVSTTTSQSSKAKKKPWSKFKSSLKSLGVKMSSKPKFAEPTESSEQKRVKKNKKFKASSSTSDELKPSTSEESPREKSPSKGPKSLIKKLSVETISTPFVGYQPSSVSPPKSYAKALHKSGSTSESNLSTSDIDTPKKSLTLDRNTKYNLQAQDSPDSGRVSQTMESGGSVGDSRPPSQITEEGYVSGPHKEMASDLSVDSDYTSPQRSAGGAAEEAVIGSLVAKTEQFAQSLVSPKEKNVDVSFEFIQAETLVKAAKPSSRKSVDLSKVEAILENVKELPETKSQDEKKVEPEKFVKPAETPKAEKVSESKETLAKSGKDEVEGRKKKKGAEAKTSKSENISTDFINAEQTKSSKESSEKPQAASPKSEDNPPLVTKPENTDEKAGTNSRKVEEKPKVVVPPEKTNEKEETKPGKLEEKPTVVPTQKKTEDNPTAEGKRKPSKSEKTPETKPAEKDKPQESINSDNKENEKSRTNLAKKDAPNETPTKEVKSPEKASTSKTPPKTLDVVGPMTDVGPLSPQEGTKMSVEEKLEAFLSAEGWTGTIKDISVKSNDGSQQPDKRECLYKILVIGELGTGKTSIIKRYVHQFFSQHYRATIGVDFALKVLNWDPNTIIRLQLWDIAGQERFGNMTRVYYKEAVGAFIVFDVTRSATFDAVLKWKQDLDSKVQLADGSPIPCVLLANKCDQQKEGIVNTPAKMEDYCKENNFSAWFETSAKENINIDEAAKSLVTQILQNDKMSQNGRDSARDGSKFPLEGKSEEEGRSCAC